jgi:hypothetical protein
MKTSGTDASRNPDEGNDGTGAVAAAGAMDQHGYSVRLGQQRQDAHEALGIQMQHVPVHRRTAAGSRFGSR